MPSSADRRLFRLLSGSANGATQTAAIKEAPARTLRDDGRDHNRRSVTFAYWPIRPRAQLVAIAGGIGALLAIGAVPLLRGFPVGRASFDAASFVGVPLLLAAVAFLASWLPSRRAARLNLIDAMRAG